MICQYYYRREVWVQLDFSLAIDICFSPRCIKYFYFMFMTHIFHQDVSRVRIFNNYSLNVSNSFSHLWNIFSHSCLLCLFWLYAFREQLHLDLYLLVALSQYIHFIYPRFIAYVYIHFLLLVQICYFYVCVFRKLHMLLVQITALVPAAVDIHTKLMKLNFIINYRSLKSFDNTFICFVLPHPIFSYASPDIGATKLVQ